MGLKSNHESDIVKHDLPNHDLKSPILGAYRPQEATVFADALVGMEPTFQNKKAVRKWEKLCAMPGGEDGYFLDAYMLKTASKLAKAIKKSYEALRERRLPYSMFARVERKRDRDPWNVHRQILRFFWPN